MSVTIGTKLGSYEITAPIGKGGLEKTSSRVVYSAIQMLPVRSSIGKMICRDPNAGPKRWPSVKPLRAGGE